MANVASKTYWRDAEGNLTTDENKGLFLVAREGAEITPQMNEDYPDLKGAESKPEAHGDDSTLSASEKANAEANRADGFARRQAEAAHGEDAGDPEKLREASRKAALKEQGALAESLGRSSGDADKSKATKSTGPAANK